MGQNYRRLGILGLYREGGFRLEICRKLGLRDPGVGRLYLVLVLRDAAVGISPSPVGRRINSCGLARPKLVGLESNYGEMCAFYIVLRLTRLGLRTWNARAQCARGQSIEWNLFLWVEVPSVARCERRA